MESMWKSRKFSTPCASITFPDFHRHTMVLFLLSTLAFFVLITGLILIHECGHYAAARAAGVVVEEFGFGLPPRAKRICTWRGTLFSLNWIPFGGFVRLKGENAVGEAERRAKGSFAGASILARCLILVAGVGMNFLLALVIFTAGFSSGRWIPTYMTLESMQAAAGRGEIHMELSVLISDVLAGGTAMEAKVPVGSFITAVDGVAVHTPEEVIALQQGKRDVTYALLVGKALEPRTIRVPVQGGKTGMYLQATPRVLTAPVRGVVEGFRLALREAGVVMGQTVLGIGKLVSSLTHSGRVPEGVTGIVGIAQLTYTSVQEGFGVYLRLVALLSLSLAALNILPFPALDGGRLLFVFSELLLRRSARRVELVTNTLGFGVLLFLIAIVTLYDILRLFS